MLPEEQAYETSLPEQYEISHGNNGTKDPIKLKLSCGMVSGQILTVVAEPADFFVINLRDNLDNILLHFILKKTTLVLNSYFEKWGTEQIYYNAPIKINERCCVTLHYENEGYRIFVNGEQLCLYKHRSNIEVKVCEAKTGKIYKLLYGKEQSDSGLWIISAGHKNNAMKYFPTNFPVPKDVITHDLNKRIQIWQEKHCKSELSSKICGSTQLYRLIDFGSNGKNSSETVSLTHGFTSNHVISAVGKTSRRFTIMFNDDQNNILLSIGVRIDQNVVVLNSFFGSWGTEERPAIMPAYANKKLCITVAYESSGYRIFVDGIELAFYKHRSENPVQVCKIEEGTIYKFSYGKDQPKWALYEPAKPTYIHDYSENAITTPHTLTFKQVFNIGSSILLTAYVDKIAENFHIILLDSEDSVLLHFDVRFNEADVPIEKDSKFTVAFVIEDLCFRIYINGDEFKTMPHKKLFHTVKKIRFENDVKVFKIIQQLNN